MTDHLMDAKAKVVVCLVPELRLPHFASAEIQLYGGYEPKIGDALIPLTDHEAALEELTERHAATERNACLMAELANEEKNKRLALLTGLEALAGRMRALEESDVSIGESLAYGEMADEIDTLTNSAKGVSPE